MFMGANELTQPHHRNTHTENQRNTDPDTQTHTQKHTYTHAHTPGRQECDMLGTSWWFS